MIPCSLAALSAIWGLLAVFAFRRLTNRRALRATVNRIYAHLLEIRLFSDEISLVWNAQRALIIENLRFLAIMAPPVLVMAVPFALCFPQLDAIYGRTPLAVGRSAMVTAPLPAAPGNDNAQYILQAPQGIEVETPAIRDFAEQRITWRIRPLTTVRGNLRVILPDGVATRTIAAGSRTLVPNRRSESSIEVDYPEADIVIASVSMPWLAWFIIISTVSAAIGTKTLPRR